MPKIIIDPGHGGNDIGDIYGNRFEKNDNLALALAIGDYLQSKYEYDVVYTRTSDTYLSQLDRVNQINDTNGDLMISIHRIVGEFPINRRGGLGFQIYDYGGFEEQAAQSISANLSDLGFDEYSVSIRNVLPILRDTNVPGLVLGLGYLNSDYDNSVFDNNLNEIAEAIADGIHESFQISEQGPIETDDSIDSNIETSAMRIQQNRYQIQVGLFANYENALNLMTRLFRSGYPSNIQIRDGLYSVTVGDFTEMDDAVDLERRLRREGYHTLLVSF